MELLDAMFASIEFAHDAFLPETLDAGAKVFKSVFTVRPFRLLYFLPLT